MRNIFFLLCAVALTSSAQKSPNLNDADAGALLKASSQKYKAAPGIDADFTLTIQHPKLKADEPDAKYSEVQTGKVMLKGSMFKVVIAGNEIYCNGKDIWTYIAKEKECQVNDYTEGNDVFSPSKLFNLYEADYAYQIKEKKQFQGKSVTVIEMAPSNKKSSFFKLDAGIDEASKDILEVKIYEKNGTRYIYKPTRVNTGTALAADIFSFDAKKHPGVKIVDLR